MAEEYHKIIREPLMSKEASFSADMDRELKNALDNYLYAYKQVVEQVTNSFQGDVLDLVTYSFDVDISQLVSVVNIGYMFQKRQTQEAITDEGGDISRIATFINFDPDLVRGIDLINQRKGFLDKTLTKTTNKEVRKILMKGVGEGLPFSDIEDQLVNSFAFSRNRAELIARTEVAYAMNEAQTAYMSEIGAEQYTISLAGDACEKCIEAYAGKTFRIGKDAPPPLHPRCRCVQKTVIPQDWLKT